MNKILFLLVFSVVLVQNASCIFDKLSSEASNNIKEILTKWENKELDLSDGCGEQLRQLLVNLLSFDDGLWALKMIDATGKFPYGLAEGNVVDMGSFDECINIKSEKRNLTGNYCSVTVDVSGINFTTADQSQRGLLRSYRNILKNQENDVGSETAGSSPLYGICLPNLCSADDVKNALQAVSAIIPLGIKCQTKDDMTPPLDTGAIVTIAVFGVITAMMVFCTLLDYICQERAVKTHPILISFSVYTNGQKLFRMGSGQADLSCIHGIRFLSMCWVILGHIFIANLLGPSVNLFAFIRYMNTTDSMLYLNCAHAVDTFFVLSGLLISYNFMKKMKKGESFNIFQHYVHRYLRLTPAYAAVILCTIYLLKYLGSGPLYYKIDIVVSKLCRDHWWKALLYLQNYLATGAEICVSQSWNLSVDYQLYILSPIMLFLLYKMPRIGTIVTLLAIAGFMTAGFVITHTKKLSTLLVKGDANFMQYYYLKTHTRAATWFIGVWLGYVLGKIKFYNDRRYLLIPRWIVLLIWLVVLAVVPVCVFGFHDTIAGDTYNVTGSSLYNTFIRPAWALCVSWIIFACTIGYGGIINDFLSLPLFGVLSRFTYSIYLVHFTILYIIVCGRRIPAYFSVAGLMSQFCSLFAISFVLGTFWILAFEMPILVIEPYIFGKRSKKDKKVNNTKELAK